MENLIESFETNQCFVNIYKTEIVLNGQTVWVLESIHKNNSKVNTRFGNELQIIGMKNTYRNRREIKNG